MKIDIHKETAFSFVLAAFVFFLPFFQRISVICIPLLLCMVLITGSWKQSIAVLKKERFFLFLIGYFFLHVIGLLYSTNLDYGFFDIQVKLSFLLFPFILPAIDWNEKLTGIVKKSYVTGCFVACCVCLVYAAIAYNKNQEVNDFFYNRFSHFLHPTYITFYINVAILFVLSDVSQEWKASSFSSRILSILLLVFFILNIIMISSRTGSLVAYLTFFFYLCILLFQNGFRFRNLVLLFGTIALVACIHFMSFRFYDRFSELKTEFREEKQKIDNPVPVQKNEVPVTENSASVRVKLWQNAAELIKDHPFFGVGTGDIKEELASYYKKNNWNYGVETRHNPHNQYLHTTVILGLVGLSLLLINLLVPLFKAFRKREWVYFLFLSIIILNAFTESVLEVQNGILFFTFFTCMFYLKMEQKQKVV